MPDVNRGVKEENVTRDCEVSPRGTQGRASGSAGSRAGPDTGGVVHGRAGFQHRECGAAVHRGRTRLLRVLGPVDRHGVRDFVRRAADPRRARRRPVRPAQGVHHRAADLHGCVAGRRPGTRSGAACRFAPCSGRRLGTCRTGGAVAHHDRLCPGPAAQPGAGHVRCHGIGGLRGRRRCWAACSSSSPAGARCFW